MKFDLPATGSEQSPAFLDAIDCKNWLVRVPLANAAQAQPILLRQLNLLHRYALPPVARFAILEVLRGPVSDMQENAARNFAGKPLPLATLEQAALERTLSVWHMLALGYLRCFAALCESEDNRASATPALLAQRTLSVFADWQVDLCRGEQLPDADYWKKLHQIFAAAETLGIAAHAVSDPVRHGGAQTSALAAYAECNLLSTASPYELPARHLAWVARWARRWGAKISLLEAPPEDIRNRAVPLWVVQLGGDVTQPAAGQLLQRVLQRWCAGGAPRRHERHAARGACSLVVGFEAAHCQLYGRQAFRAPSRDDSTLRREREEFETFGGRRHSSEAADTHDESRVENWQVMDDWYLLNESAAGLRIGRPLRSGVRIGAGLLVAVKVEGSQRFALASVRWALRGAKDSLVAGIQMFPGEPRPAAIRIVDPGEKAAAWQQGFLLPEIPALREPASLVLPAGTFKLDRSVEIMVDQQAQVLKLFRILDHGVEFERCNMHARE
ncbi:MAG: hypothetical protein K8R10_00335 [Rhodocyclales bacterium]|nr:hypothetical protein [Rhodocyclales bacterium]